MAGVLTINSLTQETLSDADFNFISGLVYDKTGIVLGESKREMVTRRLMRRRRDLQIASYQEYCALLKQAGSAELPNFVNAITTNLTSFFREQHHFDYLHNHLKRLLSQPGKRRKIRIWSAACSTGEEAYSLAMTVADSLGSALADTDIRILATDLDTNVLAVARRGVYPDDVCNSIPAEYCRQWLVRGSGSNQGLVRVKPELQQLVQFNQLNLMDSWPMQGEFELIMCRNVMIYFDRATQQQLLNRFIQLLPPHGLLMLGHSESIGKQQHQLTVQGRTIYQRSAAQDANSPQATPMSARL